MKEWICTAIGVAGSFIASLFGGWDAALATLVIFMAIDYVTGLIVAGVFHSWQTKLSPSWRTQDSWVSIFPRLLLPQSKYSRRSPILTAAKTKAGEGGFALSPIKE